MALPHGNAHYATTKSALASLCNYGSSTESENDDVEECKNTNKPSPSQRNSHVLGHRDIKADNNTWEQIIPVKTEVNDMLDPPLDEKSISSKIVSNILTDVVTRNENRKTHESFQLRRINNDSAQRGSICTSPSYSSDSSSSSSSSDESSSNEDGESSEEDEDPKKRLSNHKGAGKIKECNKKDKNVIKTKCESLNSHLPPIEDLHISVPEFECVPLGKISSTVEDLVIVRALPNTPALDLDSVLFLDKGRRPLGKIFDVIGPVTSPFYCVRFNSSQHIKDSNVKVDLEVYCAPRTEHTSFVFLEQLRKMKGSDASWKDDVEPDGEHIDYSDDEEERAARRTRKQLFQKPDDELSSNILANDTHKDIDGPLDRKQERQRKVLKAKRIYRPPNPNQQSTNAFYRNTKRYNPRNNGPIQWSSVRGQNSLSTTLGQEPFHYGTSNIYSQAPPSYPISSFNHGMANGVRNFGFRQQFLSTDFCRPPPPLPAYASQTPFRNDLVGPAQITQISRAPVNYCQQAEPLSVTSSLAQRQANYNVSQATLAANSYNDAASYTSLRQPLSQSSSRVQYQPRQNFDATTSSLTPSKHASFQHTLPPPPPPQETAALFSTTQFASNDNKGNEEMLSPPGT